MRERFNFEEIKKFTGEDQDATKQMIGIFLKSVPETLKNINENHDRKNHEKFCYFAHKLKSSIDLLSIKELITDIRLMENCKNDDFIKGEMDDLVIKLNRVLNELLPEIGKFIGDNEKGLDLQH